MVVGSDEEQPLQKEVPERIVTARYVLVIFRYLTVCVCRKYRGVIQYLVQWRDYSMHPDDLTWESTTDLKTNYGDIGRQLMAEYKAANPGIPPPLPVPPLNV